MAQLEKYLTSRCTMIEQQLSKIVPEQNVPYQVLFQAARYSLLGGGKRLRPILALATVESLGGDVEKALSAVCTLEMVHTYSLIHDDLPCMDDDDFRRGKPSLHRAFPEGQAVLAGDFLLTHAFAVLAHDPHLTDAQKVQLIGILSKRAGGDGMIGGQVMDLESEGRQIDLDRLRQIHMCKTGAMITASIEFGGVLAKATDKQMALLRHFGQEIGLAFQIVDDVLDITASKEKHGKSTASDIANDKATYVSLMGIEQARKMAKELMHSAKNTLSQLSTDTDLLADLAQLIVNRDK